MLFIVVVFHGIRRQSTVSHNRNLPTGALIGSFTIVLFPASRDTFITIIQVRMLSPIQAATAVGSIALFLLVFINNSIPAVLSFLYPLAVTRIAWTPPLTESRRRSLLAGYTYLSALLVGFFGVGVPLGLTWVLSGTRQQSLFYSWCESTPPWSCSLFWSALQNRSDWLR